jgi:hypothetical protein
MPPRPLSAGAKAIIDLVRVGDQAWGTIMSVLGWCKPNALPSVVNPLRGSNMYFLPTVQDVAAPMGTFVTSQLEHWFDPKEMEVSALAARTTYLGTITFTSTAASGSALLAPQAVCPGLTGTTSDPGVDDTVVCYVTPQLMALMPFQYCVFEEIEYTFRFVLPKGVTGRILFAMSADADVATGDPFTPDGSSTYTLVSLMDLGVSRVFKVRVPYTSARDVLSVGFPTFPLLTEWAVDSKDIFLANVATGTWRLYVDQPLLYPTGLSGTLSAAIIVEQTVRGLECFGRTDIHIGSLSTAPFS